MTGPSSEEKVLGGKPSEAWLHFTRTENANYPGLPE